VTNRPEASGGKCIPRMALAGSISAFVAVALFWPLPNDYRAPWTTSLMDLLHVPLFAGVTWALFGVLGRRLGWACGLAVALAAVGELGQSLVGRTASLADLARGVLGVVTAAVVLRWLRVRPVHPRQLAGALLVVIAVAGWAGYHYGPVFLDTFRAYRSFPELADFRFRGAVARWRTESAIVRRIAADGVKQTWVGELEFIPNERDASGIILFPVVSDWSAYRTLRCELSFRGEPLDVWLSIRDGRQVRRPQRRFEWQARLAAGRHTVRIDLDAVAKGEEFAPIDLTRVQSFHFGLAGLRQPRTVLLERIFLE
jgi:hypothetical protein